MDGFVTKAMAQFFTENPPKVFQPCAYYDKHLDCIRVQIKDCSFTESRLNGIFTIYRANHSESEHIGFSIKGIRYLFEELGFPKAKQGPLMLTEILDLILKTRPEFFSDVISIMTINLNLVVEDYEELDKAA